MSFVVNIFLIGPTGYIIGLEKYTNVYICIQYFYIIGFYWQLDTDCRDFNSKVSQQRYQNWYAQICFQLLTSKELWLLVARYLKLEFRGNSTIKKSPKNYEKNSNEIGIIAHILYLLTPFLILSLFLIKSELAASCATYQVIDKSDTFKS